MLKNFRYLSVHAFYGSHELIVVTLNIHECRHQKAVPVLFSQMLSSKLRSMLCLTCNVLYGATRTPVLPWQHLPRHVLVHLTQVAAVDVDLWVVGGREVLE